MKNYFTIGLVLLISFSFNLAAQNEKSSYFQVDLSYRSDAVFMGRKDSLEAPYVYPSMTYHHKSGFYGSGSLSYLTKSEEQRVDLILFTGGYDFSIDKFYGDISATKYFFNDESYNVISEVEGDISAMLRYDFDILNLSVLSSLYFNSDSSSDFFLSGEISHDIVTNDFKFQFTPTAGIYAGSQNFYEQFIVNRPQKGSGGAGGGHGSGSSNLLSSYYPSYEVNTQESEKFNLLAFELSLPMWYIHPPFSVSFLPVLAFPMNPATFIVEDALVEEDLDTTFYWMAGISYTLR